MVQPTSEGEQMATPKRPYAPELSRTENYLAGISALHEGHLQEAYQILMDEPPNSSCFSLAQGNAALALFRLCKYQEAEQLSIKTLGYCAENGCPYPPSWVQFARVYADILVRQGRPAEALQKFDEACVIANRLSEKFPDLEKDIELEKAHAFNSWGGSLLLLHMEELSTGAFLKARDIYRKYKTNRVGLAETLTNLAHAYMKLGNHTAAELALKEALEIAQEEDDQDQVHRIKIALIQLDSPLIESADAYTALTEAAAFAESQERLSDAFIRHGIHAQYALKKGDHQTGLAIVDRALQLEDRLDPDDPNPAKLRMTKWELLRQQGAHEEELLQVLLKVADLWFTRIAKPLEAVDFAAIASDMHEHFRLLTRSLVDLERFAEAVTAFEAGRALAHAVEVDHTYFDRVIATNPFRAGQVSMDLLEDAQGTLDDAEVLIVLTVLPPALVAFVVSRTNVEVIEIQAPHDPKEMKALFRAVPLIPVRLQSGVGKRAIPDKLHQLSIDICNVVGERTIRGVLPYSKLHCVPWRALFRDAGVPWTRLNCAVEFGLFLRATANKTKQSNANSSKSCTALGHGFAGNIDLCNEAYDFADAFKGAKFIKNCTSSHVTTALESPGVVLLSCHGAIRDHAHDNRLMLKLADGNRLADNVFPEQVLAEIVLLSACESGVYDVVWSDFPVGAAPSLLRAGARFCVGARYQIRAKFAAEFFRCLSLKLSAGTAIWIAMAEAMQVQEENGVDLWSDLACLELLGGP